MGGHTVRPLPGGLAAAVMADGDQYAVDCFADEVVVDFPSVAGAVDRIRTAFLGEERHSPVTVAMHLSARDALAGVTRPLSVPVRHTCRRCGGRGESWAEWCEPCDGTGVEVVPHQLQITVPAGVLDGTRVQFAVTSPQNPPTRVELHIGVGQTS